MAKNVTDDSEGQLRAPWAARAVLVTANVLLMTACATSRHAPTPTATRAGVVEPVSTATFAATANPPSTSATATVLLQTPNLTPSVTSFPTPVPSSDSVPRITPQEVKSALDSGTTVIVVDVRTRESYDEKHITGAISVPAAELEQRLEELPQSVDLVLYCT